MEDNIRQACLYSLLHQLLVCIGKRVFCVNEQFEEGGHSRDSSMLLSSASRCMSSLRMSEVKELMKVVRWCLRVSSLWSTTKLGHGSSRKLTNALRISPRTCVYVKRCCRVSPKVPFPYEQKPMYSHYHTNNQQGNGWYQQTLRSEDIEGAWT